MLGDRIPSRVLSMRVIPSLDTGLKKRLQLDASVSSIGLRCSMWDNVWLYWPTYKLEAE